MARLQALQVLIVEANYLITLAIRRQVQELGCQVIGEVADGLAALVLAQSRQPDVVLLDDRLPEMDGLEATRRIRFSSSIPVVLLSADDRPEARAAA